MLLKFYIKNEKKAQPYATYNKPILNINTCTQKKKPKQINKYKDIIFKNSD